MFGLDLFSGIGGLTKALEGYVEPVAYCERERWVQAALLSRMATGDLPLAPIWDDVTTLRGTMLPPIEIIYGGFPCQDISIAGRRAGLEGKRSGLFFEIIRLCSEIRPTFVFLENVSAITSSGLGTVTAEFAALRYDCRWGILSAADMGANHIRERWWLLAHARHGGGRDVGTPEGRQDPSQERGGDHDALSGPSEQSEHVADAAREQNGRLQFQRLQSNIGTSGEISNASKKSLARTSTWRSERQKQNPFRADWWKLEPDVGRVAHGVPFRVDRLRGLGNAVVPQQAREAFERLMGDEVNNFPSRI